MPLLVEPLHDTRLANIGDVLPLGGNVPDERLRKPNYEFFQLAVFTLEAIQCLLQLLVPVRLIEMVRPSFLGSNLLHGSSLRSKLAAARLRVKLSTVNSATIRTRPPTDYVRNFNMPKVFAMEHRICTADVILCSMRSHVVSGSEYSCGY